MSVDERLRRGLHEAAASPRVDTDAALVEVERMDTQVKTSRGVLPAVAAAAVVTAGPVWGPWLLDSVGGESEPVPAGSIDDPASVLAAYEDARNARDFETMRALYAEDAVITGHPMGPNQTRAANVDEALDFEQSQQSSVKSWFVDVDVSGDQATFTQLVRNSGGCFATPGDQVTVTDGKITRYTWADRAGAIQPCTPEQLAQTGLEE